MNKPTQLQKNQMIFSRTFRKTNTIADAIELIDWLLEIDDAEELADHLRFHGFIQNLDAINLAKGRGWTVPEMPQEKFDRYSTPGRFASKAK